MEKDDNQSIRIPLDDIANSANCRRESYTLTEEITINENGVNLMSPLELRITLMRIKEGIHVVIDNVKGTLEASCSRCLQPFKKEFEINDIERVFYFEKSSADISDPFDVFLVDKKNLEIDLYDLVRQEILLHFPETAVCSTHCKGLCPQCGKVLNKSKCSCKKDKTTEIEPGTHKPLSVLKDLFKDIK